MDPARDPEAEVRPAVTTISERWEGRLQNWATYMLSSGSPGTSVRISSAYSLVGRGRPAEGDGVPVYVGEALDTHDLYLRLADYLRQAVWVWYVETGSLGEKAHRLSVHRDTLSGRVEAAKRRLDDLDRARYCKKSKTPLPYPQRS